MTTDAAPTATTPAEELVTTPLLTHEVGSLMKPNWRVKANAGRPITDQDVEDARAWGERLGVDGHEQVVELLKESQREPLSAAQKDDLKRWSSRYGLALEEKAGLDVVYDGEQQRFEMYAGAVAFANGFEWRGSVRSFDNKYYSKAAVTGPISLREPYHNDEFGFLHSFATAALKVPITGAYTIADWSFDEHYATDRGVDPSKLVRVEIPREMFISGSVQEVREYVALYLETHQQQTGNA